MAAHEGHFEILQWARARGCPWDEWTCAMAAKKGHFEILRWLRGQDPPCPWDEETCQWIAYHGRLDILKWAREQDPPCPWCETTCAYAANQTHFEVLKWARLQGCPWDTEVVFFLAYRQAWAMLQWALEHGAPVHYGADPPLNEDGAPLVPFPDVEEIRYGFYRACLGLKSHVLWNDSVQRWLQAVDQSHRLLDDVLLPELAQLVIHYC